MEQEGGGWAVTIRFSRKQEPAEQERMVRALFREIMDEEHVELAYTGVYVTYPTPHAHFVVYGKRSLKQIDKQKWKRRWSARSDLNILAMDIIDIYDMEGWKGYVQKNVRSDEESRQIFYNYKMLKRIGEA